MKHLLGALLLFFLCLNNLWAYEVTRYHGVKVNHITGLCKNWGNPAGCYFYKGPFKDQINISWYENEEHYQRILDHEYAHYIWWAKMTQKERNLYTYIEKGVFDELLESRGLLMGQCNVSDYAMTSVEEDFADTMMIYRGGEYRNTLEDKCDLKIRLTQFYFNKYTIGQNTKN